MTDSEILEPDKLEKSSALDKEHPRGDTPAAIFAVESHQHETERMMEAMQLMIKQLGNDGEVTPILFGRINGKTLCVQLDAKDGHYILPDLERVDVEDMKEKEKLARQIVKDLDPVLRRDIGNVTFMAMMRKPLSKLQTIVGKLRNKTARKSATITNRVGCVFLEIEDETIQI